MLEYVHGNLLEANVEALVNTVNEAGVMGKGIALMFKEAFPENTKQYVKACDSGLVRVGKVFVTANSATVYPKWIINFPTKKHWRHPSKLEWIREGLLDLSRVIYEKGIRSIALPPLGCGNGGLNWTDVRPLIEQTLSDIPDLNVKIYAPIAHYLNTSKSSGVESLTPSRAMVGEVIRRYSVLGMECSMLEIQKLAWFLDRSLNALPIQNPLGLNFVANKYGPYADELRHLLNAMDGSYLKSEKRIADAKVFDAVYFDEGRRGEVIEYLHSDDNGAYLTALDHTSAIIEGFESPLGMELLATVDWLLRRGGAQPEISSIKNGLANWPAGPESAQRKLRIFDDRMIMVALDRLVESTP